MAKLIAISPSGVAYECDTPGEARKVTHGGKRNPSSGSKQQSRRVRHYGEGQTDRYCESPAYYREHGMSWAKAHGYPTSYIRQLHSGALTDERRRHEAYGKLPNPPGHSVEYLGSRGEPGKPWAIVDIYGQGRAVFKTRAQAEKIAAVLNKKKNPTSDDFAAGVFAGSLEAGALPPPKSASAEYRQGYATGAKVAKERPSQMLVGLGVYRATGNQAQAGREIREGVLNQNPRVMSSDPGARWVIYTISGYPVRGPMPEKAAIRALQYYQSDEGQKALLSQSYMADMAGQRYVAVWCKKNGSLTPEATPRGWSRGDPLPASALHGAIRTPLPNPPAARRRPATRACSRNPAAPGRGCAGCANSGRVGAAQKNPSKGHAKATVTKLVAALPAGVTVKVGKHSVRKLKSGVGGVVVDGKRHDTPAQAAAAVKK